MVPNYNPDDVTSVLLYVDAINLYGHTMSSFLATSDFRFLTKDEIYQRQALQMEHVMFWKAIWTILENCMTFTPTILSLQRS